jgi:hypothetical protein
MTKTTKTTTKKSNATPKLSEDAQNLPGTALTTSGAITEEERRECAQNLLFLWFHALRSNDTKTEISQKTNASETADLIIEKFCKQDPKGLTQEQIATKKRHFDSFREFFTDFIAANQHTGALTNNSPEQISNYYRFYMTVKNTIAKRPESAAELIDTLLRGEITQYTEQNQLDKINVKTLVALSELLGTQAQENQSKNSFTDTVDNPQQMALMQAYYNGQKNTAEDSASNSTASMSTENSSGSHEERPQEKNIFANPETSATYSVVADEKSNSGNSKGIEQKSITAMVELLKKFVTGYDSKNINLPQVIELLEAAAEGNAPEKTQKTHLQAAGLIIKDRLHNTSFFTFSGATARGSFFSTFNPAAAHRQKVYKALECLSEVINNNKPNEELARMNKSLENIHDQIKAGQSEPGKTKEHFCYVRG